MLLDKRVDVNARDEYGTALTLASAEGHERIVQMLLDKGVDVNAQSVYGTALMRASVRGHERIVHMLLDNGAAEQMLRII